MNRWAALSGYGKVATPASRRMRSPASTSSPPIQLARIGLPVPDAYGTSCWAVRVGSVIAWGVRMTSNPSLPGSRVTTSSAAA